MRKKTEKMRKRLYVSGQRKFSLEERLTQSKSEQTWSTVMEDSTWKRALRQCSAMLNHSPYFYHSVATNSCSYMSNQELLAESPL